jgi:hypothetical protein
MFWMKQWWKEKMLLAAGSDYLPIFALRNNTSVIPDMHWNNKNSSQLVLW